MSLCHFVPIKHLICNCVTLVWKKIKPWYSTSLNFSWCNIVIPTQPVLHLLVAAGMKLPVWINLTDSQVIHPNFFSDREPQTGSLFAYWLVIHTAIWLAPSNFREGNFTNHDNTYAYMHFSSTSCSHDVDFVLILHVPPNILSFFPFLL